VRAFAVGVSLAGVFIMTLACAASVRPAFAASGARYCAAGAGRQSAAPVPGQLQSIVAKAFGISVDMARDGAVVRCDGGRLKACWIGANLDCGQANLHRSLPGASAYCRDHPGSDFIPMVATGHDTIYNWRCAGRRAVAGKPNRLVDAHGYIAGNWREIR
jgi:hypothetical protein